MKGAIIGDIVGSIYEFHNIKTKDFPLFSPNCFFTDDTVMTVAVAAALETAGKDAPDAVISRWMLKMMRGYGRTYPNRGYGGMFRRWLEDRHPRPYYSSGNGSAMRVSPVAWFARSLEECEKLARMSAEITHNHPDGICGAQVTAGAEGGVEGGERQTVGGTHGVLQEEGAETAEAVRSAPGGGEENRNEGSLRPVAAVRNRERDAGRGGRDARHLGEAERTAGGDVLSEVRGELHAGSEKSETAVRDSVRRRGAEISLPWRP